MAQQQQNIPSPQTLTMKVKGLYTNSNELSEAPDGALKIADNIWISKDSIAESRRGMSFLAFALPHVGDRADKGSEFQGKLLLHYNNTGTTNANDSLAYYDNSTGVNTYSGVYAHPDPLLARMKFAESNKNIYFTTAAGVYKNDLISNTPVLAGMFKGLDAQAILSTNSSGFFNNNAQVAYRIVWGIKDANQNLLLGVPSQRATVTNASGGQSDVSITGTIPAGVTVNHFFQIYRSDQSASSSTVPDDNMQLVYEANPTSGQISALSFTVIDSTPDSLRGAALYTNATQEGILQSNERPPYCLDMALFQTCMFFANTQSNQQLLFTVLAVGGSGGIQSGDTITIAGVTYTAGSSENVGTNTYKLVTGGSPAQNINDTTLSMIRVINQSASTTAVYAYYLSSSSSLPGQLLIESRNLGASVFFATASAHGSAFSPVLPTSGTTVASSNTANLNGLMYSKAGQPESAPSLNILYVGSASKPIRRIVPVRNSLFIFKDDGVFRCTGVAGNFAIDTIDTTIIILAPESAKPLNNNCYVLTTQGICAVNDNGGQVMSRPIENQIVALEGADLASLQAYSFGVGYESERQYHLWTVSNPGETFATQCFTYNTFTKTWVRSTRQQSDGLVLTADNKLYLLNPSSNGISQERKTFTYADYTDEAYAVTITAVGGSGLTITLSDASNVVAGDLLYQSLPVSAIVESVNYVTNVCTMATTVAGWTVAAASLLKAIPCLIEWLPISAGNPGYLRQFREAGLIFKQNGFNIANINFYSEISSATESIPFSGSASGAWGTFAWGSGSPWGGVVRSKAFRTYIPLEKQRCDLLSVQFQCQNAWATFQIEGMFTVLHTIGERMTN